MPKGKDFISLLMLMFVLIIIGCEYECCEMNRTPEIAWPKNTPPQPVVAKAEAKKELPKQEDKPKVEEPKKVEVVTPILPPIEEPKKEPVKKVEDPVVPVDLPDLPELDEKVSMDSGFEGDKEGLVGKPANIVCKVTNKGQKEVASCELTINLPQGLAFDDNPNQQQMTRTLEKVAANATLPTQLRVIASKPGTHIITAEVKSGTDSVSKSNWPIVVKSLPKAEIRMQGPDNTPQVGSSFPCTIVVTNKGMEPLKNAKLECKLPAGLIFDKATPEANRKFDDTTRDMAWNIGELAVDGKAEYKINVTHLEQAKVLIKARAMAQDGTSLDMRQVEITIGAEIGLQVSQYDTTDPVEVGQKTVYVLEITNQGYKDATQVTVEDTIPAETKFVTASVEGPDLMPNFKWDDVQKKVVFEAIDSIKPGQKVTYKITVEVVQKGDLLNSVEIGSKDFDKKITKQEGTKAFAALQPNNTEPPKTTDPGNTEPPKTTDPVVEPPKTTDPFEESPKTTDPGNTEPPKTTDPVVEPPKTTDAPKTDASPDTKNEPSDFPE